MLMHCINSVSYITSFAAVIYPACWVLMGTIVASGPVQPLIDARLWTDYWPGFRSEFFSWLTFVFCFDQDKLFI
jgi:hypothetical protein